MAAREHKTKEFFGPIFSFFENPISLTKFITYIKKVIFLLRLLNLLGSLGGVEISAFIPDLNEAPPSPEGGAIVPAHPPSPEGAAPLVPIFEPPLHPQAEQAENPAQQPENDPDPAEREIVEGQILHLLERRVKRQLRRDGRFAWFQRFGLLFSGDANYKFRTAARDAFDSLELGGRDMEFLAEFRDQLLANPAMVDSIVENALDFRV